MRWLAAVNLRDEEVDHVVAGAAAWAARSGGTVDLLFADEAMPVPMWVTDPVSAQLLGARWDEVRIEEQKRLDRLSATIPDANRGMAARVEGRPAEEIVDAAADHDAIVLAGRRHSALGRALIGSVASKVARTETVPVLVLPGGQAPSVPEGTVRALLAVDLRAEDAGVGLDEAVRWAERLGAVLDLVHVDNQRLHVPYITEASARSQFEQEWQAFRQRDLDALTALLDRVPVANRGLPRIEEGDPADMLIDLGREYDLLLIATHGRRGVQRLMLGSVAERVMHACERPLLLLRA